MKKERKKKGEENVCINTWRRGKNITKDSGFGVTNED